MRLGFLFSLLFITLISAIGWGMYISKTNPLDYLFEIGVVLMGLGISILWQMKLFKLKPENKIAFSNWRKKPDKKFVTLFMRDQEKMLPFISPLVYLARGLVVLSTVLILKSWFSYSDEILKESAGNLLVLGLGISLSGILSATQSSYNLIGGRKQEVDILEKWKENPSFMRKQPDGQMAGLAISYILECIIIAAMQIGILYFFFGLIVWLIK